MRSSFALPDAMAVALSQMLSKSSDCSAFVAMEMGDGYFFSAIVDGDLRWIETLDEIGKGEFMERSRVIPWSALPLSQQVMFGFALAAWMKNRSLDHGIGTVITE